MDDVNLTLKSNRSGHPVVAFKYLNPLPFLDEISVFSRFFISTIMNDPRLNTVLDKMKSDMDKAIDHAIQEFSKIRAGKAHPGMLDSVKVDYYGNLVPLHQVGNVNTPDAKTIVVQPWEKSMIQAIEKGIIIANLGLHPSNDGNLVIISMPVLTEERRKETVKKVKVEAEHAKIALRTIRKEANEVVKKLQKEGLPEDEAKSGEIHVQKTTDTFIKKIEDITATKEAEIMHV